MTDLTLTCPGCGAPAEPGRPCAYCGRALVTMICPKCSAAAFEGMEYCPKCGAPIAHQAIATDQTAKCPRCRVDMDAVKLGIAVARECPDCTGLWIDAEAFDRICGDREQHSSILGAAGAAAPAHSGGQQARDVRYLHCPACDALMNRVNFAKISGVVIDVCKHDGVWLDAGELQRIIGFIDGGGLETSRARERERLVEEQHRLEALKGISSPPEAAWQSTLTMRRGEPRDSAVDVVHLLSTVINFTKR